MVGLVNIDKLPVSQSKEGEASIRMSVGGDVEGGDSVWKGGVTVHCHGQCCKVISSASDHWRGGGEGRSVG
jgi:hypothetical protein